MKLSRRAPQAGFTMLEMLLSLVAMAAMLAIAMPNLVNARQHSQAQGCVSNLIRIDAAKRQWALDGRKNDTDSVFLANDLTGVGKYLESAPSCPAGGTYRTTTVAADPTCSLSYQDADVTWDDHLLP